MDTQKTTSSNATTTAKGLLVSIASDIAKLWPCLTHAQRMAVGMWLHSYGEVFLTGNDTLANSFLAATQTVSDAILKDSSAKTRQTSCSKGKSNDR